MIFLFPSWDMLVFVEGSNKYHYQLHGSLSRMAASKAVKLATKYDKGVIHVTCLVNLDEQWGFVNRFKMTRLYLRFVYG